MKILENDFKEECIKAFNLINHDSETLTGAMMVDDSKADKWHDAVFELIKSGDARSKSHLVQLAIQTQKPETIFELFMLASICGAHIHEFAQQRAEFEKKDPMDILRKLLGDGDE
jgi:hypothetical protein